MFKNFAILMPILKYYHLFLFMLCFRKITTKKLPMRCSMKFSQRTNPKRKLSRKRRGNASVVVFSLASLLGFSALTVDHGMVRVTHAQLQNAVDAAAYGGAVYLDRTNAGLSSAVNGAVRIGNANSTTFGTYQLTAADVKIGYYDDQWTFTEVTDFNTTTPEIVTSVQVSSSVPDITAVMSRVAFQIQSLQTSASAAVVRMPNSGVASSVPCYLPLAVPDCEYLDFAGSGSNPPPTWFFMSNNNVDNVGWGDPFTSPNTALIKNSLNDQCAQGDINVDEDMLVSNGQNTSAVQYIGNIMNGNGAITPEPWPTDDLGPIPSRTTANIQAGMVNSISDSFVGGSNWGNTIQGPVALVDVGDCAVPQFTGSMAITGFTWAIIYDGSDTGSNKNLVIQLDFITERDVGGDISENAYGNITGLDTPVSVP